MSASHGDCADGCTDCPSCRGEVKPDSPVMHDLAFAIAMAPRGGDPFWDALGVAQMFRDGVGRRGGTGSGDHEIMEFVEDLTHARVAEDFGGAWPSPGGQFSRVDVRYAPPPFDPSTPGPGDHPDEEKQVPSDGLLPAGLPVPSGSPTTDELIEGRCCVEYFKFYDKNEKPVFDTHTATGKKATSVWEDESVPSVLLSAKWDTSAKFIDDPGLGCYCSCCEYRQYVLYNRYVVTKGRKSVPTNHGLHEDCLFVEVRLDEGLKPIVKTDGSLETKTVGATPGYAPQGTKGVDWWGPYCAGHRKKQGDKDPFDPPTTTYPAKDGGCYMQFTDKPGIPVPYSAAFSWKIGFLGIIHDTCNYFVPRRWRTFSIEMSGPVDRFGNGRVVEDGGMGIWSRPAKP